MGIVSPPLLRVIRPGWDSEVPEKFPEKLMQASRGGLFLLGSILGSVLLEENRAGRGSRTLSTAALPRAKQFAHSRLAPRRDNRIGKAFVVLRLTPAQPFAISRRRWPPTPCSLPKELAARGHGRRV